MVVELLKDPPPPEKLPVGSERRRSRRHSVALPATLLPEIAKGASGAAAAKIDVTVRDVSLHGAGLKCETPMTLGDAFVLDVGAGPLNLHARVRVVSSRKGRDGKWNVGVEFF
jgi:hypothetical protein